jgi:hypothetical protein
VIPVLPEDDLQAIELPASEIEVRPVLNLARPSFA